MSPPIRAAGHGKALQDALSTGILQVSFLTMRKVEKRDIYSINLLRSFLGIIISAACRN